jgi:hypothetical protein
MRSWLVRSDRCRWLRREKWRDERFDEEFRRLVDAVGGSQRSVT